MTGREIDGRYIIESVIGSGAMGVVCAARHKFTGARVAVKLARRDLELDQEIESRFLVEARGPTSVDHPGVIKVFDAGKTSEGELYLVMELLSGVSLRQQMEVGVDAPMIRRIGLELLDALAATHAAGLIHRDLKPENIFLVAPTGTVKILDFGLTKMLANASARGMTVAGLILGTITYMAPEQLLDAGSVDARADLWATTVLLYELLAGRLPHRAKTIEGMYVALVHQGPEPITAIWPDVPPAIDAFFRRALARDPAQRFATALDLAQAFAELPLHPQLRLPEVRDSARMPLAHGTAGLGSAPTASPSSNRVPSRPVDRGSYPADPPSRSPESSGDRSRSVIAPSLLAERGHGGAPGASQPYGGMPASQPYGGMPGVASPSHVGVAPPHAVVAPPVGLTDSVGRSLAMPASRRFVIAVAALAMIALVVVLIVVTRGGGARVDNHGADNRSADNRGADHHEVENRVIDDLGVADRGTRSGTDTRGDHRDTDNSADHRGTAPSADNRNTGNRTIDTSADDRDADSHTDNRGTTSRPDNHGTAHHPRHPRTATSEPTAAPPAADDCTTGCQLLDSCHLGTPTCAADCARSTMLSGCLKQAANDCNRFAACYFAWSCGGKTTTGTHSCGEAMSCEAGCAGRASCLCSCVGGAAPTAAAGLLAYNGCVLGCRGNATCIANRCSVQAQRCRGE